MAVDPSAFAVPGQQTQGPHTFQDASGRWWEYDPTRPADQRTRPLLGPDGAPIEAQRPAANKAPQLLKDKQGNIIGYWDPDQPNSAVYFNPDQQTSQVPVPLGGGYIYNPATNAVETLPPQQTPSQPTIHTAGNTTYQQLPDGTVRVVGTDTAGIARSQAEIDDARNRTAILAQQAATQGQTAGNQAFNSYWSNVINASQADEASQQNAFQRDYRLLYELPRTQVADENQARLNQYQAAANQGTYETGRYNAGTTAADSRVRQLMDTLPYRASPVFAQQFAARRAQEAQRQPLTPYTPDAFTFRAPDFEAARQAGYQQAGVTGGLPSFEDLLRRTPAFATMDPAELAKLQRQMAFGYAPPPSLTAALAGG